MSHRTSSPLGALRGSVVVPGDKSISHRAILMNTLARGPARVRGLLRSGDVQSTIDACRALGATIEMTSDLHADDVVTVQPPTGGLIEPSDVIDCGNSGTSIRLLAGVLASQSMHAVLTGDGSLRSRPMLRVVEPLRRMGASLDGRQGGKLAPLAIRGGDLQMTHHDLKIASAQVKSALLLAGLQSGVAVREPRRSRDHTERMLRGMGAALREDPEGWLVLLPADGLDPIDIDVPGDLSAAAFLLVAACLVPGSEVFLEHVGINPTRTGVLDALLAMGADIQIFPRESAGPEPVADILARHGPLVGTRIDGDLALRCLDEIPILSVAAAFAEGETTVADAAELRVKESDRISRTAVGLRALGIAVEEQPDGMVITGGRPHGPAQVDATGDHRIAMAFTVAGLACDGGVTVTPADAIHSSYPAFYTHIESLAGQGGR